MKFYNLCLRRHFVYVGRWIFSYSHTHTPYLHFYNKQKMKSIGGNLHTMKETTWSQVKIFRRCVLSLPIHIHIVNIFRVCTEKKIQFCTRMITAIHIFFQQIFIIFIICCWQIWIRIPNNFTVCARRKCLEKCFKIC